MKSIFVGSYQGFRLSHTFCEGICSSKFSTPEGPISRNFLGEEDVQLNDLIFGGIEKGEESEAHSYHSRGSNTAGDSGSVLTRATIWGCIDQLYQQSIDNKNIHF